MSERVRSLARDQRVGSLSRDQRVGSLPRDQRVMSVPRDQSMGSLPRDERWDLPRDQVQTNCAGGDRMAIGTVKPWIELQYSFYCLPYSLNPLHSKPY